MAGHQEEQRPISMRMMATANCRVDEPLNFSERYMLSRSDISIALPHLVERCYVYGAPRCNWL